VYVVNYIKLPEESIIRTRDSLKFKNYLAINVQIVHDKLFELVVMNKIMKDEDELNAEESNTNDAKFRKAYAAPATAMSDDNSEE
jgi:hypothetical protein